MKQGRRNKNIEQGIGNREYRAGNREYGRGNRKEGLRMWSREQGIGSTGSHIFNTQTVVLQVLHEQTAVPGSDLNLVYLSSRAFSYKPVLKVILTESVIPFGLSKVHLMVAVEGRMFQKEFPVSPRLSFTFIWDKTDAYGQKVYGLAEAVGESLKCLYYKSFYFSNWILS